MNSIRLENKNISENYQPTPNLYYDVEGKVISNSNKELVLEKKVGTDVVNYTLKLKEEKEAEEGEEVKVSKEEIQSMSLERVEEAAPEDIEEIGRILKSLGLAKTPGNIELVERLVKIGIEPTRANVENYIRNMENLSRLEEGLDMDKLVKIMGKNEDIGSMTLDEINTELETINSKEKIRIFSFKKDLDYKEAEEIAREVYGQKMGKDIYDIIRSLHREGLEIDRENIDYFMDVKYKLNNIKDLDLDDVLKLEDGGLTFSINNLYKIKNNYSIGGLKENNFAKKMESLTILEEANYKGLVRALERENIEATSENISLGREFLLRDLNLDKEDFTRIRTMKDSLEYLHSKLEDRDISRLMERDIDLVDEDIVRLVEEVKSLDLEKEEGTEDLNFLSKLDDGKLLDLLKEGRDFNLNNIKEIVESGLDKETSIEYKVVDRTKDLVKSFSLIDGSLEVNKLRTEKEVESLSLKDLEKLVLPGATSGKVLSRVEKDFLLGEYTKFRENINSKILKKSLEENIDLRDLALAEANSYMEGKVNRYREISRLMEEFNTIYKNKEVLVPLAIKNQLKMTQGEIKDLGEFLKGDESLTSLIERAKEAMPREEARKIDRLREKISKNLAKSQDIREDYYSLEDLLSQGGGDFTGEDPRKKYFETREKLSKDGLVLQLPVDIKGLDDLNIFINDLKSIDKNYMDFSLRLTSENLGDIDLDLKVIGRDIFLNIGEDSVLSKYTDLLSSSLKAKGYNLRLGW